jgi:SAM-dependent methyltransferase
MRYTGERAVPTTGGGLKWVYLQSVARYAFGAAYLAPGMRVLDAACGTGYGTEFLQWLGARVTACDIEPDACRFTQGMTGADHTRAVCADCRALPFRAGSFDLYVSIETIEHLPEPAAMVREARRVVHPEGRFIVSTPNRRMTGGPGGFHPHEMDLEEFAAVLGEQFAEVEIWGQTVWPEGVPSLHLRLKEVESVLWSPRSLLRRALVSDRLWQSLHRRRSTAGQDYATEFRPQDAPRVRAETVAEAMQHAPVGALPPILSDALIAVCRGQATGARPATLRYHYPAASVTA